MGKSGKPVRDTEEAKHRGMLLYGSGYTAGWPTGPHSQTIVARATLTLRPPSGSRAEIAPLCVKAVLAEEIEAPANVEPLRWVLLTTEAVASPEQALAVVRYYECRWRIEDYHKAWKSGV